MSQGPQDQPVGSDDDVSHQTKPSRRNFLKYVATGIVVAGVAVAGGYYYLRSVSPNNVKKDSITIAWNEQFNNFIPYKNRDSNEQTPFLAMFDPFVTQDRSLKYGPGIVTDWSWSSDYSSIELQLRNDVKFHNGTMMTADDVAFTIQTLSGPTSDFAGVWQIVTKVDTNTNTSLTLHTSRYDPAFPDWFNFFGTYVLPKNYFTQVGETAFGQSPIGTGPYRFVSYQNGILKLQAFSDYWGGAPSIQNVIFKEVLNPAARASEVQSGSSDFTLQIDISVYQSLANSPGLAGQKVFTTDIASFFVAPYFEPFKDLGVRQALHYALDKNSLVNDVLLGFGKPVSMPEASNYLDYDPNFNFPYDPNKAQSLLQQAGYSSNNPLSINVMTTNGVWTKDYEITQACAQMWKNVGINVTIDTITVAQFFTARTNTGTLDPLSFYVWGNPSGDPENDIGYMLWPKSSFSAWAGMIAAGKTDYTGLMSQATQMLSPIFTETNETKRIQEAISATEWCVQNGLIIPLYQQALPIIYDNKLNYTPWPQGYTIVDSMSWST